MDIKWKKRYVSISLCLMILMSGCGAIGKVYIKSADGVMRLYNMSDLDNRSRPGMHVSTFTNYVGKPLDTRYLGGGQEQLTYEFDDLCLMKGRLVLTADNGYLVNVERLDSGFTQVANFAAATASVVVPVAVSAYNSQNNQTPTYSAPSAASALIKNTATTQAQNSQRTAYRYLDPKAFEEGGHGPSTAMKAFMPEEATRIEKQIEENNAKYYAQEYIAGN